VVRILVEATGLPVSTCAAAAERADGDCRVALVSLLSEIPVEAARAALDAAGGGVRRALELTRVRSARTDESIPGNEGAQR
jgi:N-acetylmuramic acid 6-phosphate etherase